MESESLKLRVERFIASGAKRLIIYSSAFILLSPYGPTGEGTMSSVSVPSTLSAADFAVEKKTNFRALLQERNQSKIFCVSPVFTLKYTSAAALFFVSWAFPARWITASTSGILPASRSSQE